MRQSGEPYYSHPIEVAYMAAKYTATKAQALFNDTMLKVALLHDTIEDTQLNEHMISQIFGKEISSQVESLTRVKKYGKVSSADITYTLFADERYDLLLIKLFDRLHNMQTIYAKSPDKIKKIVKETVRTFLSIAAYLEVHEIEEELTLLCYQSFDKY